MSALTLPQVVDNFVTANNAHDGDALFALFAPGATVVDDGATFATAEEIRGLIDNQLVGPKVVITPTAYEDDRLVASCDGDFPGGPLTFAFVFQSHDDAITHLAIELA